MRHQKVQVRVRTSLNSLILILTRFTVGERTAGASGQPSQISSESQKVLFEANNGDLLKSQTGGEGGEDKNMGTKVKSEKERMGFLPSH